MPNRILAPTIVPVAMLAALLCAVGPVRSQQQPEPRKHWQERWVRLNTNMLVDANARKAHEIIQRAVAVGYNGVVLADSKTASWFHPRNRMPTWERNVRHLRDQARQLGLKFHVHVMPFGQADLLMHDVNLATGYPIRKARLRAEKGRLVPVSSASLANGSFEQHNGNRFARWFHDDPGKGSFVDHKVVKHGNTSIRFEGTKDANEHGHARVDQVVRVEPFQQYRVRVWMKCEDLSGRFAVMVKTKDTTRDLQTLSRNFSHHTADWTEYVTTFNSVDAREVYLFAGIWGGTSGRFWLDEMRIESVPTLNILRRASLPLQIASQDGVAYEEGRDFRPVKDPKLGRYRWTGDFGCTHEPPAIELTPDTRIGDGEVVLLSCYHALMMPGTQMTPSMVEPKVYNVCAQQIRELRKLLNPDGYFLGHDEIRTGGWEPEAVRRFETSGELFAYNIKRCYDIANTHGGGKPVCVWSDMFDPYHNARENYYMVNNTIAGSWQGLHRDLVIVTWLPQRKSLEFFANRGNRQIVAGYYDDDVVRNYQEWMKATHRIDGVLGTMYCTWSDHWDDLERYAEVWWGGKARPANPVSQK